MLSVWGPQQDLCRNMVTHIPRAAPGVLCCFHLSLPGEEIVLEKALNSLHSISIKHKYFESKCRA